MKKLLRDYLLIASVVFFLLGLITSSSKMLSGITQPIAVLLLIALGVRTLLRHTKQKKQNAKSKASLETDHQQIFSSPKTSHVKEINFNKELGFEPLYLGGYQSLSGGYCNFSSFTVRGMKKSTGRMNTLRKKCEVADEEQAKQFGIANGLSEPFEIGIDISSPASDIQKEAAAELGFKMPLYATDLDAAALIARFQIEGATSPTEGFAMYCHKQNIHFSRFVCEQELLEFVKYRLSDRDKAVLYAYIVSCRLQNKSIENLLDSPQADRCYAFADSAMENPAIMESVLDRVFVEWPTPRKGTLAFRSAAGILNLADS